MAVPMMTTRLVQTLNTFVSMVVMAQLGHQVLAAGLPISMYRIVVMLAFVAPLFVLGAMVGRQMHDKGLHELPGMLVQSWLLSLLLSVPMMILYAVSGPLMTLFHQPSSVVPIITEYFNVQLWGMPAVLLATVNQQFLAGTKHQHWVTTVSTIGLIINAVFSYGLTLGHFGMPAWGVFGASLANVITMWICAFMGLILVLRKLPAKLAWSDWRLRDAHWIKKIAKIGTPVSLQITGEMLSIMVVTLIIGWLGEVAMAASQISQQYMLFAIVPIFGLSEAASIRVGHAIANKQSETIRALGRVGIVLSLIMTGLVGLVFALFHKPLAQLFLHQLHSHVEAIYHLTLMLLLIRIIAMLFDGVTDVVVGLLRGLYDTRFPMMVSIVSSWVVMLPLAYVLGIILGYGVIGIALGGAVTRLFAAGILFMRWLKKSQDLKV